MEAAHDVHDIREAKSMYMNGIEIRSAERGITEMLGTAACRPSQGLIFMRKWLISRIWNKEKCFKRTNHLTPALSPKKCFGAPSGVAMGETVSALVVASRVRGRLGLLGAASPNAKMTKQRPPD
jgi:hypothetical protein